jgi:hypothetical protein
MEILVTVAIHQIVIILPQIAQRITAVAIGAIIQTILTTVQTRAVRTLQRAVRVTKVATEITIAQVTITIIVAVIAAIIIQVLVLIIQIHVALAHTRKVVGEQVMVLRVHIYQLTLAQYFLMASL